MAIYSRYISVYIFRTTQTQFRLLTSRNVTFLDIISFMCTVDLLYLYVRGTHVVDIAFMLNDCIMNVVIKSYLHVCRLRISLLRES